MGRIIGIDLGTTNSLVSVWDQGKSILIPNSFGEYLTPSVVSFDPDGTVYVGKIAKDRLITHPECTQAVFKRFMPATIVFHLGGHDYSPVELSAFVLRKLKEDAECFLGEPVEEAIISVPAYFNDIGRTATKNAGILAGLKVERIINEPSAAALAYKTHHHIDEGTFMIVDFGGGTLDVSIVDCFDHIIEIISVSGDNHLGGTDFDEAIANAFYTHCGINPFSLNASEKSIVKKQAELAKMNLSLEESTNMTVTLRNTQYHMIFSRRDLMEAAPDLFKRILVPIRKALSGANESFSNLSGIILVGGTCKMPVIKQFLAHVSALQDIDVYEPDHMIAYGTGIYAGIKERNEEVKDLLLTDVCPFSLGVSILNRQDTNRDLFSAIIEKNSSLPISKVSNYVTTKDNQKTVTFHIYQGDGYYADENLKLGKITIPVPPNKAGKESISVRFTYDINGILMIDFRIDSTGKQEQLLLHDHVTLSEEELKERIDALSKLRIHPRDLECNKQITERFLRVHAESSGYLRIEIQQKLAYFETLLERQDTYQIEKAQKYMQNFLDYAEDQLGFSLDQETSFDTFLDWYSGKETEDCSDLLEIEDDFKYWLN